MKEMEGKDEVEEETGNKKREKKKLRVCVREKDHGAQF